MCKAAIDVTGSRCLQEGTAPGEAQNNVEAEVEK